jgi:hypothetical protein
VRRPGEGDQQPHEQRRGDGKESVIEKSDRDKTENQMGTPPEPDVLMKYVKGSDRNNKQDAFHVEWTLTLTKRLSACQENTACLSAGAAEFFGVDVVALDHAVEGFAIDGEDAGGCLFVASRVFQNLGDITSFNLR